METVTQSNRKNTMAPLPENTKLDSEYLKNLEIRVSMNRASSNEYKQLDDFIESGTGVYEFILTSLKAQGLDNYQEFIDERKRLSNTSNIFEGLIVGRILGAIQVLKN